MKYTLKKTNYRNVKIFKDNVLDARTYFIPYSSFDNLKNTDVLNERYSSDEVTVLSGDWDFKFYKHCAKVPDVFDSSRVKFDSIKVPSVWQRTGYLEPVYLNWRYEFTTVCPTLPEDMPAGIYRKKFDISDLSKQYVLTFLGAANNLEVYVNGSYVGYSEGTHNTSEYDITEYLTEGENELIALSYRWCTGSYLEAQDMFRENGIIRDVLLTKRGKTHIDDFHFDYKKDGESYKCALNVKVAGETDSYTLDVKLFDKDNTVYSDTVKADKNVSVNFDLNDIKEWNAEIPSVYELYITLKKDSEEKETVRHIVGFKHIEIDTDLFKFNDKLIKFKGVNHHDTHPVRGYCMTHEDYLRDIKLMKEFNVNAVRTSHYPPDPIMLTLCDIYGIYVIDEADIETHGIQDNCGDPNAISDNLKWKEHYLDRVHRMYERDKNHPSITMWSLGNESGWLKNHIKCYEYLKSRGTTIPVHYEGACSSRIYGFDVVSRMYPSPDEVDSIGKKTYGDKPAMEKAYSTKPLFLCEYAHAMGVGPGSLEDYCRLFLKYDNVTGGCIWEWADHSVLHSKDDKKYKNEYTYGGDHGEKRHDGNFCVDGLFYPDRTPHTGAFEMKNCYRPIRAAINENGEYVFTNTNRFRSTRYINIKWSLDKDGKSVDGGEFTADIAPEKSKAVSIKHITTDKTSNWIMSFKYIVDSSEIAQEQIILNDVPVSAPSYENGNISVSYDNSKTVVHFDNGTASFDDNSGKLVSYIVNSTEYLNQSPASGKTGLTPNVFRAPIDNDRNIKSVWMRHSLDKLTEKIESFNVTIEKSRAEISVSYSLCAPAGKKFDYAINYSIGSAGDIKITLSLKKTTKALLKLPRFGVIFEIPEQFNTVKYFGRGIKENLSDFNAQSPIGIYEDNVHNMHEDYIYPQDNSNHSDVKYIEFKNNSGAMLKVYADDKLTFSAHDYTQENLTKALHREDIERVNSTVVSLDGFVRGAGSNSCGPETLKQYTIDEDKKLTFSFTMTAR